MVCIEIVESPGCGEKTESVGNVIATFLQNPFFRTNIIPSEKCYRTVPGDAVVGAGIGIKTEPAFA